LLLDLPLAVRDSRGYDYAEVTAGGITLQEVDWRTMESRVCPGVYAVGEILDVDGRIGGFNFQWAWSSARVAAAARGDIPLLAAHFVQRQARDMGRELYVPDDVMGELLAHEWPGNVRELENALARACVLARGAAISLESLGLGQAGEATAPGDDQSLEAIQRAHVQRVLAQAGRNKSRAAEILGVSRPRLDRIIARHNLVV
jgi:hypothetical protein